MLKKLLPMFVALVLILSACGSPTPEPTKAPEPAQPSAATEAPVAATEAPAAAPEPTAVPAPTFNGTVTVTFVQEPDNLNPLYTDMYFSLILREFYLKPAWTFDEKAQPVPVLVTEIPSSENGGLSADGKTVTLKLRDDITWSDGEKLTADDFVFTYEMTVSEKNVPLSRYPYEDYVTSVTAPDPTTVVVTFSEPFAPWLTRLFTYVLPKHVLQPVFDADGTIDQAEWNRNPTVSLGPLAFTEWETGSHITFTANPTWIDPVKIEQVFVRIVPDDAAQEAAIIAGDTDFGVFLSSDQIQKLEADGKVKVVALASGYNEAWFMNVDPKTANPAMLDVNVRKALALATDRFTIVKDLLVDTINPVNANFWDTTLPFGNEDIKPYPYDPEQAKQLLDAADWKDSDNDGMRDKMIDGKKVDLKLRYITNQRELRKNVQAVVEQQLKLVGIGVELVNYSSDVFWNGYNDGGPQAQGLYEMAQYSSTPGGFPDGDSNGWTCEQRVSPENPDGSNTQGYCNPALDELFAKQATTLDPAERLKIFKDIQKIIYDDVVYIGFWKDPDLWSINSRVANVKLSGVFPFWNVNEWEVK